MCYSGTTKIFWLLNSNWIQWTCHGEAPFVVPVVLTLRSTIMATMKHIPECKSNCGFFSISQNLHMGEKCATSAVCGTAVTMLDNEIHQTCPTRRRP
jgi:hypothetical protein